MSGTSTRSSRLTRSSSWRRCNGSSAPRRQQLLATRGERRRRLAAGEETLGFLTDTASVRQDDWQVAPVPEPLAQRWVEITGPTDRKLVINALNSGADGFMADCEDATSPTWHNIVDGQLNLRDAVDGSITYDGSDGRHYELVDAPATLLVRPRGWHLPERHLLVDSEPVSGSLFDFGMYFFHSGPRLLNRGLAPFFYLPKLESHLEARLWNDVFCFAQDAVGLERGTIKATVLIETLPAAFEMDEILYELRDHSAGLNAGRWDYIFSAIKVLRRRSDQGAARPLRRDDDGPVHACLRGAAGRDLPPPRRARDRRHVGADPVPQRPGGQPGGAGGRPGRQAARGRAGL